jgi:hypothetical protein
LGVIVGIHGASLALALSLLLPAFSGYMGIIQNKHSCSPSSDEQILVTKHVLQYQICDEAPMKSGLNVRVMIIKSTIYFLNEYLGLRQLLTIESRVADKNLRA